MAGPKGQANKGDRSSASSRHGETDWFKKNRLKKRRRDKIAKASKKRNR